MTFSAYSPETGFTELGQVEGHYVDMGSFVMVNDHLYFYAWLDGEVTLFDVDPQARSVRTQIYTGPALSHLYVCALGDAIVVPSRESEDSTTASSLVLYDAESGTWSTAMECQYKETERSGCALYRVCTDGDTLWTIQDEYDGQGTRGQYLVRYSAGLEELERVSTQGPLQRAIQRTGAWDFKVVGRFVYVRGSNYGFLGEITDGEVVSVKESDSFKAANTLYSAAEPAFFDHGGSNFYTLDTQTGQLTEHSAKLLPGREVLSMWYTDETLLFSTDAAIGQAKQYFRDRAELQKTEG